MTVKDLRKLLKNIPDDADIIIHEGTTNLVTEPRQIYLGNDGNLWICTEDDNFAAYIHPENQGRLSNEMFIQNLKIDHIEMVWDELGYPWTIEELEQNLGKRNIVGPYYYSDPTED